jgi:DNA (cytosine-5)-methyltransferase 1
LHNPTKLVTTHLKTARVRLPAPKNAVRTVPQVRRPKLFSLKLRQQIKRFNEGRPLQLEPLTFIDLFSGCGGFGLGFLLAGFRPLAAIDYDREACDSHRINFDRHGCISTRADIRQFKPEQFAKVLKEVHGRKNVDVILGGPPCQGWSRAGRGKLTSLGRPTRRWEDDPRNILFRRFVTYVRHFRPKYFIMENVPGMLSHRGKDVTPKVIRAFARIGYRTEMYALDAVEFGVPQRRTRLFFIGTPKHSPYSVRDLLTPTTKLNLYHRG